MDPLAKLPRVENRHSKVSAVKKGRRPFGTTAPTKSSRNGQLALAINKADLADDKFRWLAPVPPIKYDMCDRVFTVDQSPLKFRRFTPVLRSSSTRFRHPLRNCIDQQWPQQAHHSDDERTAQRLLHRWIILAQIDQHSEQTSHHSNSALGISAPIATVHDATMRGPKPGTVASERLQRSVDPPPVVRQSYCHSADFRVGHSTLQQYRSRAMKTKTCPDCNGDGVVDKGEDSERRCPTCGGSGFVPDDDDDEDAIRTTRA